jgi:hypothetical protein
MKLDIRVFVEYVGKFQIHIISTSTQITFTTNRVVCPQTTIYNTPIPMKIEVTYLGLHLDQRLTWQAHIKAKCQQLNFRVKNTTGLLAEPLNCQWKTNCYCIKPC